MTARTLWVPKPPDQLNSIQFLLDLAADNISGDISAADLRTIIEHFASVDSHLRTDVTTAQTDAADAKASAASAVTAAHGALSKTDIDAGETTLVAPTTSSTTDPKEYISENKAITFSHTFAVIPHVVAVTSSPTEHGNQRKVNVGVLHKTTTGATLIGLWTYHTAPPISGWTVHVDWIAIAI